MGGERDSTAGVYVPINHPKVHFEASWIDGGQLREVLADLCSPTSEVPLQTEGRNKSNHIQGDYYWSALSIQKIICSHEVLILCSWQCEINDKETYPPTSYILNNEYILTL